MHWAILCELAQLPACGARGFDPEGLGRDTLFVVRRGDELRAYRNDCPHWPGSPMAWRKDAYLNADGTRIACHSHGAQFEIDTGLCVAGPCVGQSLDALELCVDEDGTVWAADARGGAMRIAPDGTQQLVVPRQTAEAASPLDFNTRYVQSQGSLPNGMAFLANGDSIIANWGTDSVEVMTREGPDAHARDHGRVRRNDRAVDGELHPFGGADLHTVFLGSLRGSTLPSFRSPVAGLPLVHWNER